MPDVDLEAQQVVGEEEEAPPKKRFAVRKSFVVIAGIVVVEAILLVSVFSFIQGGAGEAEAAAVDPTEEYDLQKYVDNVRILDLGTVSIYDENDPQRSAPRRYTLNVKVFLSKETMLEIESIAESDNPDALEFVKDDLRAKARVWMLSNGGESLRTTDMQIEAGKRLRDYLAQKTPALKASILGADLSNFRPQKW